jgi:hypothetical protein
LALIFPLSPYKHVFVNGKPQKPVVPRDGRPPGGGRKPRMLRDCRRHGTVYFGLYSAGPTRGDRWRCTKCLAEAVTRRHQHVKQLLVDENGGCCALCGYDRTPNNLHFHHVDPTTKQYSVNMARGKSLAAYRAEAAKCVLVCANCHGEIEAQLIPSPPPGATYGGYWDHPAATPPTTSEDPEGIAEVEQARLFDDEPLAATSRPRGRATKYLLSDSGGITFSSSQPKRPR